MDEVIQIEPCVVQQAAMAFTFSGVIADDNGKETDNITMTLSGDDLDYLPNVMKKFQQFLRAIGYDYITIQEATAKGLWQYHTVN
jgi:hypothetical protein